ncbi:signal transduction histidine kinase [Streptosporangium album]|uniref:histidine kinase n=1 Tax=Streptosporangium album TaxID=47479 RepID=A0A7W7RQ53_9ACTN|nr:DUF4118 domain-containing protein [Streptosporangium album]MBB4936115.1 signal transduction histidine kinase [Streptosporangium album]
MLCVTAEALLTYPLQQIAPGVSLGVVYLLGVLVVSLGWGLGLGMATAVVSGIAFDYFNNPPFGTLTIFSSWSWMPLVIFLVVALLASWAATLTRSLAVEADERRREADLDARLARLLLRTEHLRSALPAVSRRLAQALGLPFLAIELGAVTSDDSHTALPLLEGAAALGTLVVPAGLPEATLRRLNEWVVPSLNALLRAAHDREAIGRDLEASRDELRRVAQEQAALRRVATLVARGVSPAEMFGAVAREMGLILQADCTAIERYEPDRAVVVGSWSGRGPESALPPGSPRPLDEQSISALVLGAGRPMRMTDYDHGPGEISEWARAQGITSSIGSPIVVEARLWGVMIAFFNAPEPQPASAEERMLDFTELVATAISNAQARDELAASRARVVAASDETRHRIERDLHDGAQQRLVSLGLDLRATEATLPPELAELRTRLSRTVDGLTSVAEDLRELSRGLHPAILSKGGLGPALKTIARRSAVPVDLVLNIGRRLPESVEVAVYYIVSEALTNVAKHAHATMVCVELDVESASVEISIRDDGLGGADPHHGSGLIGLSDRIQALGGRMDVVSPAGGGTTLLATIPVWSG